MKYTIDLYKAAVESSDKGFENVIRNQMIKATDWQYGGYLNKDFGLVPYGAGGTVANAIMLYFCPESKFYMSDEAYHAADLLFTFLYNNLRPSGVIDLHLANYYSAPDTSFTNIGLCKTYNFIKDRKTDARGEELKKRLYEALSKLADGIFTGGFHTPNHRWVESAALSLAMNITGKKEYLTRINAFLNEGIDCNEDGEYAERSAGGYNQINNMAMLILAEELNKPELLEPVRRNLKMMAAYYHTNFEIFTQNSTRQDRGTSVYADKYIYQYLKAGHLLKDNELLGMARAIIDECIKKGRPVQIGLTEMMTEPELVEIPDVKPYMPTEYDYHFKDSGIVRMGHNGMTVSIMENNETFFFLQSGEVDMYIRGGIHFFNERHIKVKNIRKTEDGYLMDYHGEGTYYLPYKEYQGTSDFNKMDRSKRDTTGPITVDATLEVKRTEKGFAIRMKIDGCTKAPVRFEMGVNPDAVIFGDGYTIRANAGGKLVASKGYVKVEMGNSGVKIGPAFAETFVTEGLFGSVPVSGSKYNIFFNALTPFDHEFTIEPIEHIED